MRCTSAVEVDLPNGAGRVRPRLILQCTKDVEDDAEPGSHAGACTAGEVSVMWRHDPAAWVSEPQKVWLDAEGNRDWDADAQEASEDAEAASGAGLTCGTCGRATFPHPYRHPIT